MPEDYRCSSCSLVFMVGNFHYFKLDSGYGSKSMIVCRNCGTQHAIEHSIKKSSKKDRLLFQTKPIHLIETEGVAREKPFIYESEFLELKVGEEVNLKTMKDVQYKFCNSKGTFSFVWKKKYKCPNCGGDIKEVSSWTT